MSPQLHLSSQDLDRSDMGCLKKPLLTFMEHCHILELLQNNCQFEDDSNSAQSAIENSMPPEIPSRSKIEQVTEYVIQNVSREMDLGQIVYLNLFQNRIRIMTGLEKLINLNTLILSFNQIESIECLQECRQLKTLDMSHNFLRKLEGLVNKQLLAQVNFAKNWIQDPTQLEQLKSNCPNLKELGLKCNPIAAKKTYRAMVFLKLPKLLKLDGISLTDRDKAMVRNKSIVLNYTMIQGKSYLLFCLWDGLEALRQQSNNMNTYNHEHVANASDSDFERSVEILILNHRQISKIESLELFVNLRKLQLIDNCITKIEGLGKCRLLEELSLEKNKITQISELQNLRYLKKLDLGRNRIRRMDDGLKNLESLTQLSMEDNCINQLDGLDGCQTLMELYLGNNMVFDTREITKLKSLGRLIILDISGNSISRDPNYRIYCIFHLRKLKVLDGVSIES